MSRFTGFVIACATAIIAVPGAWAEDSQTVEEVRVLRGLVEKQSKQIEALTEQIAKLRIVLEKSGDVPLAVSAPAPAAIPVAAAAPAAAPAEFSTEAPKAEPPDGKRHVVIKGETLTSIAKHYSITITDLKKANKEVDERKLQIGQTLTIPSPKTAEAPAKKDENP